MSVFAMKKHPCLILALAVGCSAAAFADEDQLKLKEGPGHDTVMTSCIMCHSVDYIHMNSPFMKKPAWQATVNKMVKVMGAPVSPEDVPVIVDYLTKYYGIE